MRSRSSLPSRRLGLALVSLVATTNCHRDVEDAAASNQRSEEPMCERNGGAIKADTTFTRACSPYELPTGIDVINGATLTIEPGVEVRFRPGDWLEIGATGRPGRLVARGTVEQPITLSSAGPPAADGRTWFGVWFHSGTLEGSVLSHAIVEHGGGTNRFIKPTLEQGCLTMTGVKAGALSVSDVRVRDCANGAWRASTSSASIARLSLEKTPLGAIVDAASFGSLKDALTSDGPVESHVTGGAVTQTATWSAQGTPVLVDADVSVGGENDPTLTLAAGLALHFSKRSGLHVGETNAGALVVAGTPESGVELAAATPADGWQGVVLGAHADGRTALSYATLRGAAETAVAIEVPGASLRVEHSTFRENPVAILLPCGARPTLAGNEYGGSAKVKQRGSCH